MSKQIVFPSLSSDQITFVCCRPEYYRTESAWYYAQMYDSLGDGMVQHSPMYSVGPARMLDFLMSLGAHLLDHFDDTSEIAYRWFLPHGDVEIKFFASIKYKDDGKIRYYSRSERKLSSSPSKKHDKRYEEIEKWMDGSFEAVFRMMDKSHYSALDRWHLVTELREYYARELGYYPWIDSEEHGFGLISSQVDISDFHSAFDLISRIVISYRNLESAKRTVQYYREKQNEQKEAK